MIKLHLVAFASLTAIAPLLQIGEAFGQSSKLPARAKPPQFEASKFEGVFFTDVNTALSGELPKKQSTLQIASAGDTSTSASSAGPTSDTSDKMGWKNLISSGSLEDLVKESKLRLDKIVTTPTAFAGGGYNEARKEFSLLSLLFAIIENYPDEVRWKNSSSAARAAMERTSANTKVGSRQVYDEVKKRLMDLDSLMSGTPMTAEAKTEIAWENLIDISPVMKLLDWAHNEQISKMAANEDLFKQNQEAIGRYADLVAILGKTITFEKMPNADDDQFVVFAKDMIGQAQQLGMAVKTGNAELARTTSGKLGQCCTNCHDSFN
jgi:hypothetical protein